MDIKKDKQFTSLIEQKPAQFEPLLPTVRAQISNHKELLLAREQEMIKTLERMRAASFKKP